MQSFLELFIFFFYIMFLYTLQPLLMNIEPRGVILYSRFLDA